MAGNNSTHTFKVSKDTNILNFKGSQYTVTKEILRKGTIFSGTLRSKVVSDNGAKKPVKVLQVDGSKDYVELSSANMYIDELAKADKSSFNGGENDPTTNSPYDKNYTVKSKAKNAVLKYGFPIGSAYLGYHIAKKKGLTPPMTIALIIGLGLVGYLPYVAYNRKKV